MAENFLGTLLGTGNRIRKSVRGLLDDPQTEILNQLAVLNENAREFNLQQEMDTAVLNYNGVMRDDPSVVAAKKAALERQAEMAVDLLPGGAIGSTAAKKVAAKTSGLLGLHPTTTPGRIINKTRQNLGYSVNLPTGENPTSGLMMGLYRNTDPRNAVLDQLKRADIEAFASKKQGSTFCEGQVSRNLGQP
jgi:hypothetical protein